MKARTIRRRLNRERGGGREPYWRRHWRPMKRYLRAHPETISGEVGRSEGFVLFVHSEWHPTTSRRTTRLPRFLRGGQKDYSFVVRGLHN